MSLEKHTVFDPVPTPVLCACIFGFLLSVGNLVYFQWGGKKLFTLQLVSCIKLYNKSFVIGQIGVILEAHVMNKSYRVEVPQWLFSAQNRLCRPCFCISIAIVDQITCSTGHKSGLF